MKSKIKLALFCIVILMQNCTSKQSSKINIQKSAGADSIYESKQGKGVAKETIIDSLPIYADVKVMPYSLDSMMAEVTFINDWHESVWLYKPILPSDSLVENSFVLRIEHDNKNVPHIHKKSNHKYYSGYQDLLPTIIPSINDSSQLELMPGTRIIFKTNLSKHYDFKSLNRKLVNAIFVRYSMDFPYIKGNKQIYQSDPFNQVYEPKPTYIYIRCTDNRDPRFEVVGERVVLPIH